MILAGVDVGTNTIRLLIADVGDSSLREVHSGRTITRLGEGLDRTGVLSPEAQDRSLQALYGFSSILRCHPGITVRAVGTSALRRAGNAAAFLDRVLRETGLAVSVIDGAEEARLTLAGVSRALPHGRGGSEDPLRSALLLDIGGGSTEIIVTDRGTVRMEKSLDLGAVYLHERHLRTDPPSASELDALRSGVAACLDGWERELERETGLQATAPAVIAGSAGTITTLAAMDQGLREYDPGRINGYSLSAKALDRMIVQLSAAPLAQRRQMPGLERGREDIILAGAVICRAVLDRCGRNSLLVSDWGLREGIVIDLYARRRA